MFNNHNSFRIIITCSFLDSGQHCWSMFVNKNFSRRQNLRRRWRMYKAHPRCTFRGPRARASLGKFWNLVLFIECIIYCILEHELGTIWTQHFTNIMKFWLFFIRGEYMNATNYHCSQYIQANSYHHGSHKNIEYKINFKADAFIACA